VFEELDHAQSELGTEKDHLYAKSITTTDTNDSSAEVKSPIPAALTKIVTSAAEETDKEAVKRALAFEGPSSTTPVVQKPLTIEEQTQQLLEDVLVATDGFVVRQLEQLHNKMSRMIEKHVKLGTEKPILLKEVRRTVQLAQKSPSKD
jgi:hypothetical protein